jgi:hypothetical protein
MHQRTYERLGARFWALEEYRNAQFSLAATRLGALP